MLECAPTIAMTLWRLATRPNPPYPDYKPTRTPGATQAKSPSTTVLLGFRGRHLRNGGSTIHSDSVLCIAALIGDREAGTVGSSEDKAMAHRVQLAESVQDLTRCFPVLRELRPTYDGERFVAQVQRQTKQAGYAVAFLEDGGEVRSVAGFRVGESLAWHKTLYVDDLVTREVDRSKGYGEALFDWLVERARSLDCDEFHLDSGVHRFGAHRFYLRKRMDITSHHFALKLK